MLMALAAMLFLFDVALRRLRLALLDLRRSGAAAMARALGRVEAVVAPAQARLLAAKGRIVVDTPSLAGRPGDNATLSGAPGDPTSSAASSQPSSSAALSSRLLEAKKRAKK
jgi:hypothetical protein